MGGWRRAGGADGQCREDFRARDALAANLRSSARSNGRAHAAKPRATFQALARCTASAQIYARAFEFPVSRMRPVLRGRDLAAAKGPTGGRRQADNDGVLLGGLPRQ